MDVFPQYESDVMFNEFKKGFTTCSIEFNSNRLLSEVEGIVLFEYMAKKNKN